MNLKSNRRLFLKSLGLLTASAGAGSLDLKGASYYASELETVSKSQLKEAKDESTFFKISLAQWSLHKALLSGKMTNLDFPVKAKTDFNISAVEYVNVFFKDKANDQRYLSDLKGRCDDNGVISVLIMCDGEGFLGDLNSRLRNESVENHKKWVEAAKFLGCHSIRVNAKGIGTREEVFNASIDGLRALAKFAKDFDINVIVENHGGYSSDGQWLTNVIKGTEMDNCGTLPDFGNFCIRREIENDHTSPCADIYDRYLGVKEMMPFAKGVSAKVFDFDLDGNCIETDYRKMLPIVKAAKYTGYIGIEYEGDNLPEDEGIKATKILLEKVGASL